MLERSVLANSFTVPLDEQDGLKARFVALWARCLDSNGMAGANVLTRLIDLYAEPHRHYHTLGHIRHCLHELDQAVTLMDDPDTVELALWFHDAIYVSGAKDNERRSADLFREYAEGQVDSVFQQRIDDLIMATTHSGWPRHQDEQFIVDIDLSSFGLPWEDFMCDGLRIRAEFAHVEDEAYYPGHLRFLRGLCDRPSFFFTDCFRRRYEHTARENIRRLIADLSMRGYD
jgi:predicted metal-dependent HD superfamily phosphohydrolase